MPKIITAGENAVLLYFGNKIDKQLPKKIGQFAKQLKENLGNLVVNIIPSYTSLHISYDLNKINHQDFIKKVKNLLKQQNNKAFMVMSKTIYIPVYYGDEVALDLAKLLLQKKINKARFINLHTTQEYQVYAIGFSPVFAYLAEVDVRIQMPRLVTPRVTIPSGSIGIADNQTAIYPTRSSGGWNIIGCTPLDLSLNKPENIDKFHVGDKVKFYAITRDEYLQNGGKL